MVTVPARSSPDQLQPYRNTLVHMIGIVLAVVIFVIDIEVTLDYAVGMLYVLVIVLGVWTSWRPYPMLAAIFATGLLIVDLVLGWSASAPGSIFVNRPLMALVFMATAAMVSRFKQVEREYRANVQQLADVKRALDHAAIVATTDVTGRILYVNDKFCEISKYSREELLGQDHRIINSGYHPKTFFRDLWRTIGSGQVWHGEIRNRAKDGSLYWVDTTIVPFLDARGKPYQYIAIRADITARKQAEQRLAQQAALARIGQMAAVVAHEVRNPLAGIKGAMQVMMLRRRADDADLPVMRDVVARIDALGELINDLMVFARPRAPRPEIVALRPLVDDAIASLRRDPLGTSLEITAQVPEITLVADAEMLKATLQNLLINSAQAMNGRGQLALTAVRRDDVYVIEVRDTGPGIPETLHAQVFEPFFTTKSRGGGLGLPIARRTAELHGGTLTLACPAQGGTVATLTLPAQGAPTHHASESVQISRFDSAPGHD